MHSRKDRAYHRPEYRGFGLILLIAAALSGPGSAYAQAGPFEALRVDDKADLTLDGKLDDPLWRKAPVFDAFHQNYPSEAFPAKVRTELRLILDKDHVWIGLNAFDDGPAKRRLSLVRRDQVFSDQDMFLIVLDPYGRKTSAPFIRINPAGSIGDGVYNQDNPDNEEDYSPDYAFDAQTHQRDDGWSAELRIPLASLRFPINSATQWHLLVFRMMPREGLTRLSSVPLPRDLPCLLCGLTPVQGTQQIAHHPTMTLTPQMSYGQSSEAVNGAQTQQRIWRLGGNFKIRPTAGWVIDGTIKPDFSSVELDIPQLGGNTRRALYYPEKRPFFLESSELIEQRLRLISTRSIEDPLWGVRATYRDDSDEWVMLTARDRAGGTRLIPGPYETQTATRSLDSQASFIRGRHHMGPWVAGITATDRSDADGFSRMLATDLAWRPTSIDIVRTGIARSETRWRDESPTNGQMVFGDWVRMHDDYGVRLNLEQVSPGFRADNGFLASSGYRREFFEGFWKKHGTFGLTEFAPMLRVEMMSDQQGQAIMQSIRPGFWFSAAGGLFGEFELKPGERIRPGPAGPLLTKNSARTYLEARPFPWLPQLFVEADVGERVDYLRQSVGRGYSIRTGGRIRLGGGIQIEPQLLQEIVNGGPAADIGKPSTLETMAQVRAYYQISNRQAIRLTMQKHTIDKPQLLGETGMAQNFKRSLVSLVYSYTPLTGRSIYVGATRTRGFDRPDKERMNSTYAFVNVSWTL